MTDLANRLSLPAYPRSAKYDPAWQISTMMGPNVLWLTESLTAHMDLRPGMRVLDLGCGMAASSIFLAKEFGVQVFATDLWIGATENFARIREAGVEDRVIPIHAEAHALPFADGFFDAVTSMDAYQYFGTDNLYAPTITRLLKPEGQLGISVPGLTRELETVPEELAPWWEPALWAFHSAAWWRRHLERTGPFTVDHAGEMPDGIDRWVYWARVCGDAGYPEHYPGKDELPFLEAVQRSGALAFAEVVARARS